MCHLLTLGLRNISHTITIYLLINALLRKPNSTHYNKVVNAPRLMHQTLTEGKAYRAWFLCHLAKGMKGDVLETMALLFADDAKMVTWPSQSINHHSSLTAAWDRSKKWDLPINPSKCNYLTIGREVPLTLSFFPDGSDTPIPVSKLDKDLGVQTESSLSFSYLTNLLCERHIKASSDLAERILEDHHHSLHDELSKAR